MMHAPVSSSIGLGLILFAIPVSLLAKTTTPNGATLLAIMFVVAGFLTIIIGNERMRHQARMFRGAYTLEPVGSGRFVFGNTDMHRAVEVRSEADLHELAAFMAGGGRYDRRVVARYLNDLGVGVAA